jgi:hypothetical protein
MKGVAGLPRASSVASRVSRQSQDIFLRSVCRIKFRYSCSLAHHENAIATTQKLGQFRTHQKNPFALRGKLLNDSVDIFLGADIDATSRIIQE